MSQSQMQEITCPKCGKKQFFRVWDSINTMEDPPLKEAVRNDEAFSFPVSYTHLTLPTT
mgnify:CR=1 FL=1